VIFEKKKYQKSVCNVFAAFLNAEKSACAHQGHSLIVRAICIPVLKQIYNGNNHINQTSVLVHKEKIGAY